MGIVNQGKRDIEDATFRREGMDLRTQQFEAQEKQRGITNTYNTEQQRLAAERDANTAVYRKESLLVQADQASAQAEAARDVSKLRGQAESRQNRQFNLESYETFGIMPDAYDTESDFAAQVMENQDAFRSTMGGLNGLQSALDSAYQRIGSATFDQLGADEATSALNSMLNPKNDPNGFSFEGTKVSANGKGMELYVSAEEMTTLKDANPQIAALANIDGAKNPKAISFDKIGQWVSGQYSQMQGGPQYTKQSVDAAIGINQNSPATSNFARTAHSQRLNSEYRKGLQHTVQETAEGMNQAFGDLEPAMYKDLYTQWLDSTSSDPVLTKARDTALDSTKSAEDRQQALTSFHTRMTGLVVEAQQGAALNAELGTLATVLQKAENSGAFNLATSATTGEIFLPTGNVKEGVFSPRRAEADQSAAIDSIMRSFYAETGSSPGESGSMESAIRDVYTVANARLSYELLYDLKNTSPKLYATLKNSDNPLTWADQGQSQSAGTNYNTFEEYEAARDAEKKGKKAGGITDVADAVSTVAF
jgi:truncated hemoglobin YjbI